MVVTGSGSLSVAILVYVTWKLSQCTSCGATGPGERMNRMVWMIAWSASRVPDVAVSSSGS